MKGCRVVQGSPKKQCLSWSRPLHDSIKINVDIVIDDRKERMAVASIARDSAGRVKCLHLGCFAKMRSFVGRTYGSAAWLVDDSSFPVLQGCY